MNSIRIILCDDYKNLSDSYKERLELEPDITVSAVFYSGAECLEKISDVDADILLLDIQMETKTIGVDIIPKILEKKPNLKIIMLSSYNTEEYIFNAFTNGASNFILKDDPTETMLNTIHDVYNDRVIISSNIAMQILSKVNQIQVQHKSLLFLFNKLHQLTKTEFEVLAALENGMSYAQIAKIRFVEENTIRKIASNILHKFDSKSMKELLSALNSTQLFEYFK